MTESAKADDYLNKVLQVVDIVVTPAESVDPESGHLERWARTVILLADGGQVAFGSRGILKSLAIYCSIYGGPPWEPYAEFTLKSTPIGKNRWYTLEAAPIAPAAGKPAKK